MTISLSEAARLTGIGKTELLDAIQQGKLPGFKDEITEKYRVKKADLLEMYPSVETSHVSKPSRDILKERIRNLENTLTTIASEHDRVWKKLESESEERRRLSNILAEIKRAELTLTQSPKTPWPLFVIALSTLIGAVVAIGHLIKAF